MDSGLSDRYDQESLAERGGDADDWGHHQWALSEWWLEGVFSGYGAGDGEGGAGECGDFLGG